MRLLRLSNSVPAATLVLIGAYRVIEWPLPARVWWAAAAMWCVTAFGYVSNDLHDYAEDRLNKPDRPLPSGTVAPHWAGRLSMVLALAALLLAWSLGWAEALIALIVLGLLTLYNRRFKASAGGGNLLIAGLAGCALLAGGVAAQGFQRAAITALVLPALLLASFVAARELLKTLEDRSGDQAVGKMTAAVRWGERGVLQSLALLSGWLGILILFAATTGRFSAAASWLLLVGILAPLAGATSYLWPDPRPQRVGHCLRLLKSSYFIGLIALIIA